MENISHSYQEIILVDDEYFRMLIQDINSATKSIDFEVYIFSDDEIAKAISNSLIMAAKRGVKVRLLVDGAGTQDWENLRKKMENTGVSIKPYHPLFWTLFKWPIRFELFKNLLHFITHINSRNHRKTCIIDKEMAYIGSANIVQYSNHLKTKQKWHDVTIKIQGIPLDELMFAFEKAWKCISFKKNSEFYKIQPNPVIRLNYTWMKRRNVYKSLLEKIDNSKTRIYIACAYFVPRKRLLLKLIKAARKGVSVIIILPKNPDVVGISSLMSSFYYVLLEAGAEILLHDHGVLHAKFLIIDDRYCIGSSNLNYRSFYYDLEADVTVQTAFAKNELDELFNEYFKNSCKLTMDGIKKQSLIKKIVVNFLWMFRFLF